MAIFHMSIKIISRGKGKSAVAAAAYRAAEKITNMYNGITSDYTKKTGVIHTEIMLPQHAPMSFYDRSVLWNSVEEIEKPKNAQLAREIELALPKELSNECNIQLVQEYVKQNFISQGMCADFAIHDKNDGNPHVHIMLTMRPLNEDGTWGSKQRKVYHFDENGNKIYDPVKRQYKCTKEQTTDWNNLANAEEWRAAWIRSVNAVLEQNNIAERVDHRSFIRQGKQELPTVHLGVVAHQMEQKGIRTERGDYNRNVQNINSELRQIKARIRKLQNWLDEEAKKPEKPMLANVIQDILSRQSDIREKLKPVERRLKTLDEHIKHADNFKRYRPTKRRYDELYAEYSATQNATGLFAKGKAQKALDFANNYYESNRAELTLFNAAERYIKDVMQERYDPKKLPPITKWKAEFKSLSADKDLIYREYYSLKDEVKEVEKVRRQVEGILQEDKGRNEPMKKREEYGLE